MRKLEWGWTVQLNPPVPSRYYEPNPARRNPILFSKSSVRYAAFCVALTYLINLIPGQLSHAMTFAGRHPVAQSGPSLPTQFAPRLASENTLGVLGGPTILAGLHAPFFYGIAQVVGISSEKKVCWVDTRFYVATMANEQWAWITPSGQIEREYVCSPAPASKPKLAVAVREAGAKPLPTFFLGATLYAGPESFAIVFGWLRQWHVVEFIGRSAARSI